MDAKRIGLAFNRKPPTSSPDDVYVEWDDEATIGAVEAALAKVGDVVRLEATAEFPLRLMQARPDIVFNMVEGLHGPNREAHVPSFCEFWNVPCTGSDSATLSLCLDKGRTKQILAYHGLPTPEFVVSTGGTNGALPALPVIVKPLHEGSSKGIRQASLCRTRRAVRDAVQRVVLEYGQPALVERWLPGREFTCAVLGNGGQAQVLPIVELNFDALPDGSLPLYSYEAKWIWDDPAHPLEIFECPADIPRTLAREIRRCVLAAYRVLRCRDWARIDVRCDGRGRPQIIEVNPLPGILPDPRMNSCFPKAARSAGMDYETMIAAVLGAAAARYELAVRGAHA